MLKKRLNLDSLRPKVSRGASYAVAGAAGVAGSYAATGFTRSYLVSPIEGAVAEYIPGAFITFTILVLGDLGEKVALVTATALSAALLGVVVAVMMGIGDRAGRREIAVPLGAGWVFATTALISDSILSGLGAALGAGAVVCAIIISSRIDSQTVNSESRREVVGGLLALVGVSSISWAIGGQRGTPSRPPVVEDSTKSSQTTQLLDMADERSFEIDGLEPLVSESFYTVDISSVDPQLNASEWTLSITGDVEQQTQFDYTEIVEKESTVEPLTLRCVGEQLNGKKTDTAVWEGVPVATLLEEANVPDNCCVMARAADDFYEEFPVDALRESLLVYRMNGEPLPRAHGYPVRLLVPGHWGEINVKWITELEILDEPAEGYWEEKGWHGTGPVNTIAKLYVVNDLSDGRKVVAGHAYAGTRGVSAVEVSTDGGETWNGAELTEPLPGRDVWRQWKYEYEPPSGEHEVVVRAIDQTGEIQPQEESGPFPSGPTGWVSETVE